MSLEYTLNIVSNNKTEVISNLTDDQLSRYIHANFELSVLAPIDVTVNAKTLKPIGSIGIGEQVTLIISPIIEL